MLILGKTLVWAFLLAMAGTAGITGMKLTEAIWQVWQGDTGQGDDTGLPPASDPGMALEH
ncbi:MAG TPA: hypothetical protein VG273_21050 [Bryobacteraceae bacterium]|jgi:hypothetical protein|nr:hypothetical protein [Bryobacteraceae bacterium]